MATSFTSVVKDRFKVKAIKLFAIVSLFILTIGSTFGQVPVWTATYPSVTNITAVNCNVNANLTNLPGNVTVYYIIWRFPRVSVPADVKAWALSPASCPDYPGTMLGGGSITYNLGDAGTTKSAFFEPLLPGRPTNQANFTVEYGAGLLLPTAAPMFANPNCVDLNVLTSRVVSSECVNQNLTFLLDMSVNADPQISGVYKGTTWKIVWGDGSADMTYTSLSNSDYPSDALRTHLYSSISDCTYKVELTVNSPAPCSRIFNVSYIVSVHGRDIPADGDGELLIADNTAPAVPVTIIEVCEGNSHTITLKDISTWNCQNPLIGGLPAPKNDAPRTVQWVYGQDDGGTLQNTIGLALGVFDPVVIGGVNNTVRTINGYEEPIITPAAYQGELSQTIEIPATCRVGEYYDVYLRNWNKCNPYSGGFGDPAEFTKIRILVIASPSPPVASDKTICIGGDATLSAVSGATPGILLTWYANADKTVVLTTGGSYDPGALGVGTYTYYVADGAGAPPLCEGPVTEVELTVVNDPIAPVIAKNPADATLCAGTTLSISVTTPGSGGAGTSTDEYSYSTNNGSTWSAWNASIPSFAAVTGTNLIRSRRNSTASGCISNINSVSWTVVAQPVAQTITKLPNVTAICTSGSVSATFSGGSGGITPTNVYFSSINGGGSWQVYIPGNNISSAITGVNRIQIRTRRETTGTGCTTTAWTTVTWDVVAQPVAQTITKLPNVTEVCTSGSVSATFSGGSGGVSPTDVYFSSIDGGGSWQVYIPGNNISSAITGANRIRIRTRRESTGTGCTTTGWTTVTWDVVAQPVAQTITKLPNVTEVCTSGSVSATFSGGSGGITPTDVYFSSIDGGGSWQVYIPGNNISSAVAGVSRIRIRTRRETTGTGCTTTGWTTVTWDVVAQPVAQTITKLPNVTEVCTSGSVSATFSGGSGGVTPTDVYFSSINGGTTWQVYIPGNNISSVITGANRIQIRTRRESTGTGCTTTGWTTVSWDV
ncbi:MAG TPA: hypothetical protein VMV77_05005, partial [Bacteroidales bacterium]|nr:hypothetical protein [Bacteroidales bacterium]